MLRFWVLKLGLNKHDCFKMFYGVVVNLCITSFADCTHPKHQETTAFSHVLPDKPFHRKDGRINLSSLHAQEGQESKISTKAKEKKTQVTMEMASLRQDDVAQDMASATHDLSDVRRKCLRPQNTRIRIRRNRILHFCVNINSEWCIRFHATAVCNCNCTRVSGVITLAVYPSQFQCFKVKFHTLLKWECQREITR